MLLTQAQINYQAQKANWYVQVDYNNLNVPGDPFTVTGDGVDDLDSLIPRMQMYPRGKYSIDLGTQYEIWTKCDVEDIQAIRTAYIAYYGSVSKPGFPPEQEEAIELT